MQQLVQMPRMRILEDGVLQVVDTFLDAVEEREVCIDHLVDNRVEKKIGAVGEDPSIARQSRGDIIDRRHDFTMDCEEKVAAEECRKLVGLRAVFVKVHVDGAEYEKVVVRKRVVLRQRVG